PRQVAVKRWDLGWLKGNRPLLISELVGIPLVVGWLLYFYFQTRSDFALVLIALLPVFVAVNILGVNIPGASGRFRSSPRCPDRRLGGAPAGRLVSSGSARGPLDRRCRRAGTARAYECNNASRGF